MLSSGSLGQLTQESLIGDLELSEPRIFLTLR
jgi:hypothetical protein